MDLLDAQPEFTKAFWDYLDGLVNDDRIRRGQEILAQYRPTFDAMEKAFGVDRYIITAIWGVESNYSTLGGDRSVLRSTAATLALHRPAARLISADEFHNRPSRSCSMATCRPAPPQGFVGRRIRPDAMGLCRPTFKRYAIDFDGDGHRDVVDSVPDLVASTANNLKRDVLAGSPGRPVAMRSWFPSGFNYPAWPIALRVRMPMRDWERHGLQPCQWQTMFPRTSDSRAYLMVPAAASAGRDS